MREAPDRAGTAGLCCCHKDWKDKKTDWVVGWMNDLPTTQLKDQAVGCIFGWVADLPTN